MKSLQASSSEGRLFLEGFDRWMSVEACNWKREGELDCHREDEESRTAREAKESLHNS